MASKWQSMKESGGIGISIIKWRKITARGCAVKAAATGGSERRQSGGEKRLASKTRVMKMSEIEIMNK
jgi:hypothetical protein